MDFLRSQLIMNAPLSVGHFQSSLLGGFAVALTVNGQLTRAAFIINDFIRIPYFSTQIVISSDAM